jgi:hypothetical protein
MEKKSISYQNTIISKIEDKKGRKCKDVTNTDDNIL